MEKLVRNIKSISFFKVQWHKKTMLCVFFVIGIIFTQNGFAQAYNIKTVAGSSNLGDGGAATFARLQNPSDVTVDAAGNLYVVDQAGNQVRKITSAGIISTFAGNGTAGYSGDGADATAASFNHPDGIVADAMGNIYISDLYNNCIRQVNTAGVISTFAGVQGSFAGDGFQATSAILGSPNHAVADAAGNVYIADQNNYRVRKISTNGIISTFAGTGNYGFSGDGGQSTNANLGRPSALTFDALGNLYIADQGGSVRMVNANGVISTLAGIGYNYYAGDGGPAVNAGLYYPSGIAIDAIGNIYISELYGNRIRMINTAGIINTIAGNGSGGYSGDGAAATDAQLYYPNSLSVDAVGNLYIADQYNYCVRMINTNGIISTFAGTGGSYGYSGDGSAATAAQLSSVTGVTIDAAGNVYIGDAGNYGIRKVDTNGIITTFAAGTYGETGDGGPATAAGLSTMAGISIDAAGNMYIAESYYGAIRKINAVGIITTIGGGIGDGAMAANALIKQPKGLSIDASGNIYVLQNGELVRKINTAGIVSSVAGNGSQGYSGDGGPATAAKLNYAYETATDAAGNLYIADNQNYCVRMVNTAGVISVFAGIGGVYGYSGDGGLATSAKMGQVYGITIDVMGNIYIGDAGNGRIRMVNTAGIINTVAGNGSQGYSGDGGAATDASLNYTNGITIDASGNLFIADNSNKCIRKVNTAGIISTYAGGSVLDGDSANNSNLDGPISCVKDAAGNLYIADQNNNRIRKVNTNGIISTVVGNGVYGNAGDGAAATDAQLASPAGVAVDATGNIYIADQYTQRVRVVNTAGVISIFAGTGYGFSGDGGAATDAQLSFPVAVALDNGGNVYIADANNNRVRMVNTNGVISTFAGNGTSGFAGDGGAATDANINGVNAIAADALGNIYLSDRNNQRIRMVNTNGIISTVVGSGSPGSGGDGGAATDAYLYNPDGVAVDAIGNIYIGDFQNNTIRMVNTNGIIKTIAGNGNYGFYGDGGPATSAYIEYAGGLTVDGAGNVFFADINSNRIRELLLLPSSPTAILGDSIICNKSIQTYSVASVSGATNYTWVLPNGWVGTSTTTVITTTVNSTGIDLVTVTANSASGSSAATVLSVTVNVLPTIIVRDTSICTGQSFTITPSGALTYTFSSGNAVVTPTANATYSVTGTDANGCVSDMASISSVTVNDLPTITVNSGVICAGTDFTITPNGADTYTFSSGSNVVTPTTSRSSYSVTGTDVNGCVNDVASVSTVTLNAAPIINSQSGNTHTCEGNAAVFSISSNSSNDTYQWSWVDVTTPNNPTHDIGSYNETGYSTNSMTISPMTTPIWGPSAAFGVLCVVKNTNNCVATSMVDTIFINPLPIITVNSGTLCTGNSFTITPNGAMSYTFSGGSAVVTPTTIATYSVTGTDANGCVSNVQVSTVTVSNCGIGIEQNSNSINVSIYPNPSNGVFTVSVTDLTDNTMLSIYNSIGQLVYTKQLSKDTETINTNLSNGFYTLKLQSMQGTTIKQIVIAQ
jgi:hypothetical protein